jgi:hypothetical protein
VLVLLFLKLIDYMRPPRHSCPSTVFNPAV